MSQEQQVLVGLAVGINSPCQSNFRHQPQVHRFYRPGVGNRACYYALSCPADTRSRRGGRNFWNRCRLSHSLGACPVSADDVWLARLC